MFRFLKGFTFILALGFSVIAFSQEDSKAVTKRKAQLEKQEEKKKKMGEKAHDDSVKKHQKIQTKETRKRMKKNKKKSKRVNDNRKEFFLKRWFS